MSSELMTREEFISKWLGRPYKLNGRETDGVDCYGIVLRYYSDVIGLKLPDWEAKDSRRASISEVMSAAIEAKFEPCAELVSDAIVLVRRRLPHHLGVFLMGRVLHAASATGVVLEPKDNFRMRYGQFETGVPRVS